MDSVENKKQSSKSSSSPADDEPTNIKPSRPAPPAPPPPQIPKVKPMFVDIHEHFDYALLKRFYDELMIPNFPMEDGMSFHTLIL